MTLRGLIEAVERGAEPGDLVMCLPDQATTDLFYAANRGSLDAAKRLHDALLPGWRAVIRQRREDEGGGWFVRVESADFHSVQWTAGDHTRTDVLAGEDAAGIAPDPARAWLLAILRALDADQREGGE